jgi:hypothetical protein
MKTLHLGLLLLAFAFCPVPPASAADDPGALTPADILKQAQAAYARLTSYRDSGKSETSMGGLTAAECSFTIQLARTNLYKVIWWQGEDSFTPKGAVWSAGNGDFLWMSVLGSKTRKQPSRELALASATGVSGGAAASIPGTFFKQSWGGLLAAALGATRLPDAKVGATDCFVLKSDNKGRTNTLFVAKADFLIRQVQNDISGRSLRQMMEQQAEQNPQVRAMLAAAGEQMFQDTHMVETHENLKLNEPVTVTDFDFPIPATKP